MSTKCRVSSAVHPAVRHRSGSIACSTIDDAVGDEERPDRGRQQRDRGGHDVFVPVEAPRGGGPGRRGDEQTHEHAGQSAHGHHYIAASDGCRSDDRCRRTMRLAPPRSRATRRRAAARRRARQQPAQRAQVPQIPGIGVAPTPALGRIELRSLQQHRQMREPRIVQQAPERFEPETALADVLVPIDPAAARPLRVVQVKRADPVDPHDADRTPGRWRRSRPPNRGRSPRPAGGRCRGRRRPAAIRRGVRESPPDARSGGPDWCPGRRCARAGSSFSSAAAPAAGRRGPSAIERQPLAPRCRSCTSRGA